MGVGIGGRCAADGESGYVDGNAAARVRLRERAERMFQRRDERADGVEGRVAVARAEPHRLR